MALGIVSTTLGMAQGLALTGEHEGLTVFRGIPYAAPPVGPLRWAPPADPDPWEGVKVFDSYKPICIQAQSQRGAGDSEKALDMSEDCLYLNITTPAKSAEEKLPVFVWLHGGGLTNGSPYGANMDHYEPFRFAKRGVVVVDLTHRLNVWGFMALPQLSAEQGDKSGNYGMMDLLKAMDWIYDNIERFGGDRENISAGGCSGGTQKTCILASIPQGKNRIRRIYNSSGLKWRQVPFLTVEEGEKAGQAYLKYIGIDPDTPLEELRAMDSFTIHPGVVPREYYPGDIIYDGVLIPEKSIHELFDKYLGDVDFINVCAQGESNIFATHGTSGAYGSFTGEVPITGKKSFYEFFKGRLGELYDKYDFENLVKVEDDADALYTAKILGSAGLAQLASNNHSRNNMVNRLFGQYMKERHPQSKVYSLFWCYAAPKNSHGYATDWDPKHPMADHGSDPRYVFDTFHFDPDVPWSDTDRCLSDVFGAYWYNFVRTGNVNGEGLPYWPDSGENYGYMEVKEPLTAHTGLDGKLEELICEYVSKEYGICE